MVQGVRRKGRAFRHSGLTGRDCDHHLLGPEGPQSHPVLTTPTRGLSEAFENSFPSLKLPPVTRPNLSGGLGAKCGPFVTTEGWDTCVPGTVGTPPSVLKGTGGVTRSRGGPPKTSTRAGPSPRSILGEGYDLWVWRGRVEPHTGSRQRGSGRVPQWFETTGCSDPGNGPDHRN